MEAEICGTHLPRTAEPRIAVTAHVIPQVAFLLAELAVRAGITKREVVERAIVELAKKEGLPAL